MSYNPNSRNTAPQHSSQDFAGAPYNAPPSYNSMIGQSSHGHSANDHNSQPSQSYWVAPDGTRHIMTEQQIQQMLSQAPALSQPPPRGNLAELDASSLPAHREYYGPASRSEKQGLAQHEPQLDSIDQEMLAEAHNETQQNQPTLDFEKYDDAALEESLSWLPKSEGQSIVRSGVRLAVPVAIPQTAPGIQSPFSRAWAPILADHDVRPQEFLQFMDHLNVCKAASPPLQLLNLAGTVVGFTPVPFAFAISMGTSAVAAGGMMAVARVRITRYLERVNREYFHPRGLQARIAKQNTLPQLIGQPSDAPLLAPLPPDANASSFPSLRDRRMQALGRYVAPIRFEDSTVPSEEHNLLDKMSAKMTARKARKTEEKMIEKHMKHQEDKTKEGYKVMEERAKIEGKMAKASRKGDRKKLAELEGEMREAEADYDEKVGEGGNKEVKAAKKFMFVVIQDLQTAAATADQHQ